MMRIISLLQRWVRNFLDHPGSFAWLPVAVGALAVGGIWAFIHIADEVVEGETQHFDEWAVRALRRPDPHPPRADVERQVPIGPEWLAEVGRDITGLGGVAVLSLATLGVMTYLLMVRKLGAMWLVLAAAAGGLGLSSLLKRLFSRPRPAVTHFSYVYTSSFPSGHSMLSAAVYLTLGILLARVLPERRVKIYCLGAAVVLTALVGISRVYMGVHYPTDVLAGWCAGAVWAMICWLVARYLQHRRLVEADVQ